MLNFKRIFELLYIFIARIIHIYNPPKIQMKTKGLSSDKHGERNSIIFGHSRLMQKQNSPIIENFKDKYQHFLRHGLTI